MFEQPAKSCDGCTMCCQIVPVEEIGLRAFTRCQHERHVPSASPGCAIYQSRPSSCRLWHCQFAIEGWDEDLRPSNCGVVVDCLPDMMRFNLSGMPQEEIPAVQMWVVPGFEDAFRRDPVKRIVIAAIDSVGAVLWRYLDPEGGQLAIGIARDPKGRLIYTAPAKASLDYIDGRSTNDRLLQAYAATEQKHGGRRL